MLVENEMKSKLEAAFAPEVLEIRNDSSKHAGHAGDDGSGESHFHITIRAAVFADMNRIARHRAIHAALGKDLVTRVHALGLTVEA
jgi:BolA protein